MSTVQFPWRQNVVRRPLTRSEFAALGTVAESAAQLEADIASARAQWVGRISDARARYEPIANVTRAGLDLISRVGDMGSPEGVLAAWDSITSLVSLAGPVGAILSGWMEAINAIARALTSSFPAHAHQLNFQHYAYLERWVAENVLGIRSTDSSIPSNAIMRSLGWFPLVIPGDSVIGRNSGSVLYCWIPEGGGSPRDLETNLRLFSEIAGPRTELYPGRLDPAASGRTDPATGLPYTTTMADVSEFGQRAWINSDEGAASMVKGRELANVLVGRGWQDEIALQGGTARAFVSDGLIFVNNLRYSLAERGTNVWVSILLVRTTMLPDELLVPLGTQSHLEALTRKATSSATISVRDRRRIDEAAWGPNNEALKRWNLLNLMHKSWGIERSIPFSATDGSGAAILAEIAGRQAAVRTGIRREGGGRLVTSQSTGLPTVAIVGGTAAAIALVTKLLKLW